MRTVAHFITIVRILSATTFDTPPESIYNTAQEIPLLNNFKYS